MSTKDLIKTLKKHGFILERNGPHQKWSNGERCAFVPQNRAVNKLTAFGILKQAGIDRQAA